MAVPEAEKRVSVWETKDYKCICNCPASGPNRSSKPCLRVLWPLPCFSAGVRQRWKGGGSPGDG